MNKRISLLFVAAILILTSVLVTPVMAQDDLGECNLGNTVNEGISGRGILYHTSDGEDDFLKDYFGIEYADLNVRDGVVTIGYAGNYDAEEYIGAAGSIDLYEVGYYNPNISDPDDRYVTLGWFFFGEVVSGFGGADYVMQFAASQPDKIDGEKLYEIVYGYWGMQKCEWDGDEFYVTFETPPVVDDDAADTEAEDAKADE